METRQGNKRYTWGILSGRSNTDSIAIALSNHPDSHLLAIGHAPNSPLLPKIQHLQERLKVPRVYPDYESLIIDKSIDCVYVDVPLTYRSSLIRACLSYKKHVLCDAPMCENLVVLQEVQAQARQAQCLLMEGALACYMPPWQRIMDIIAHQTIGEVLHVQASASQYISFDPAHDFYKEKNGGIYYASGRYPLLLATKILGTPKQVLGHLSKGSTNIDEAYNIVLHYSQGQSASLFASSGLNCAHQAHIYGTNARIHIHAPFYGQTRVSLYVKNRQSGLMKFNYDHNSYYYAIEAAMESLNTKQHTKQLDNKHWTHQNSLQLMGLITQCQQNLPTIEA